MFLSSLRVGLVGDQGQFYEAFIVGYAINKDDEESYALVTFYSEKKTPPPPEVSYIISSGQVNTFLNPTLKVPLSRLRRIKSTTDVVNIQQDIISPGSSALVWIFSGKHPLINSNNNDDNRLPYGAWWPCRVTKSTPEAYGVDILTENLDNFCRSEIVDRDSLRVNSQLEPFSFETFQHIKIGMSQYMPFEQLFEDEVMFDFVRRLQGPVLLEVLPPSVSGQHKNWRLQFTSMDNRVVRRVGLLEESLRRLLHFKGLQLSPKRRVSKPQDLFREIFSVEEDLLGMAIGQQGRNISEARQLPGVSYIHLDDETHTFLVAGTSCEAVRQARAHLEYGRLFVHIPTELVSRLIGNRGAQLQEIVDKSQVVRAYVTGGLDESGSLYRFPNGVKTESVANHTPLQLEGRRCQLEDALMLVDFCVEVDLQIDSNFGRKPGFHSLSPRVRNQHDLPAGLPAPSCPDHVKGGNPAGGDSGRRAPGRAGRPQQSKGAANGRGAANEGAANGGRAVNEGAANGRGAANGGRAVNEGAANEAPTNGGRAANEVPTNGGRAANEGPTNGGRAANEAPTNGGRAANEAPTNGGRAANEVPTNGGRAANEGPTNGGRAAANEGRSGSNSKRQPNKNTAPRIQAALNGTSQVAGNNPPRRNEASSKPAGTAGQAKQRRKANPDPPRSSTTSNHVEVAAGSTGN